MQERMRQIREAVKLNQRQFAERIGVSSNMVSTYETRPVMPSNSVLTAICKEFNVNRQWLESGDGPMFNPPPGDLIDRVAEEYHLNPEWATLIRRLVQLPPEVQKAGVDLIKAIAAEYQKEPEPEPVPTREQVMQEAARIAAEQWDLEQAGRGKNRQSGSVPTAG